MNSEKSLNLLAEKMLGKQISILFVMRDPLPPTRPDVKALFGKYLYRLGVRSDLIGPYADRLNVEDEIWASGAISFTGKAGGMIGEVIKSLRDIRAICKLSNQHDIIQVRDRTFSAIAIWILARIRKKPIVYRMSFPMTEGYEARALEVGWKKGLLVWIANHIRAIVARAAFYGFIVKRADHIFVQSDAMLEWMNNKGVARERMTSVPMGVDIEAIEQIQVISADDIRLDGRRVIIYLGTLSSARNPEFMLEVVDEVRKQYPDVLLVLAGDGEAADEQAWLRQKISDKELESHVWLTGWLSQEHALGLVKRAELGLSPIPRGLLFDVSSPTKALEYLALGIPCLGSDIPDQRFVLETSGAGLCVPMTVQDFVSSIEKLLADRSFASSLGERGLEFIKNERSYERIALNVAKQYHHLLS